MGWNLGVLDGSSLLIVSVPTAIRLHADGLGEVAMAGAAAAGAPAAGLIIALGGFGALGITGTIVGVIAVVAVRGAAGPVAGVENLRGCGRGRS